MPERPQPSASERPWTYQQRLEAMLREAAADGVLFRLHRTRAGQYEVEMQTKPRTHTIQIGQPQEDLIHG